jgi:hypothetical protein
LALVKFGRYKSECTNLLVFANSDMCGTGPDRILNQLDLAGHSGQDSLPKPVKFVKTAPGPALDEANKYSANCPDVNALIAVEHQDL